MKSEKLLTFSEFFDKLLKTDYNIHGSFYVVTEIDSNGILTRVGRPTIEVAKDKYKKYISKNSQLGSILYE